MDIVDRVLKDRPAFHAGGAYRWDALPETLRLLASSVGAADRTLETGCGVSTVIFAASGAKHTVISPDRREHQSVADYCVQAGIGVTGVDFVEGFSDQYLPAAGFERQVDLAFIDGAHAFPYPVVDWHYISKAIRIGGVLVLDDVQIPAVNMAYRYMKSEPCWRFEGIMDRRTAVFVLAADPPPEDWTLQRFNDHPTYSFLPLKDRFIAEFRFRAGTGRHALARRFPIVKKLRRYSD